MINNYSDLNRLAKNLTEDIEVQLGKAGVFYRIFFRCKLANSLTRKLSLLDESGAPKYNEGGRLLQDMIGIRINLYFIDDIEIVTNHLKSQYKSLFVDETIDKNTTTEFKPTRTNLIFRIDKQFQQEFREVVQERRIDSTFEIQIRTVLSEGWHEVEHDLRYKCLPDWHPYPEMSRIFNGFLAAFETQEWSMIQLFERMTYNHYKTNNTVALIRTKLRIRITDFELTKELDAILTEDNGFLKDFFKLDRLSIMKILFESPLPFPLTISNVIFIINHKLLKFPPVTNITPPLLLDLFQVA